MSRLVQPLIDTPDKTLIVIGNTLVGRVSLYKSGYETLSQPQISAEATKHLESLELAGLQLRRRGEAKI
jgi:hypothetical protein